MNVKGITQRQQTMLDEYSVSGVTLEAMGEKYNLTRERIRQIITKHPDFYNVKAKKIFDTKKKVICKQCGNELLVMKSALTKFCNAQCRNDFSRTKGRLAREERFRNFVGRTCTKCHEFKDASNFYVRKDKLLPHSFCKQCHDQAVYEWKRKYPEQNRRIVRKAGLKHYEKMKSTPEGRQRMRESCHRYYLKIKDNPEYREAMKLRSRKYMEKLKSTEKGRLILKKRLKDRYQKKLLLKRQQVAQGIN